VRITAIEIRLVPQQDLDMGLVELLGRVVSAKDE